jgi:hypothetical protein
VSVRKVESDVEGVSSKERGATLLMVAGMLVALLGVSAFAVDLGWIYLNTSRLQKAADAAALAGVVNLPASPALADVDAQAASGANDFIIGNPATNTFASQVLPENQYEVTLGTQVDLFFLRVLGFTDMDITRRSTAQYVLPVPMGSPANCFGIGDLSALNAARWPGSNPPAAAVNLCDNYAQNFWGAVNGTHTAKEQGDPFMPACITSSGGSCSGGANSEYNAANHYFYGIDVPAGKSFLDVWVFDFGFYDRPNFDTETGDNELGGSTPGGAHTTITLKRPDITPHDPADNPNQCSLTVNSGSSSSTYRWEWARVCPQIANPAGGTWILKVETFGGVGGTNQYALLANTSGIAASSMPRIYGINDMSVFTNEADGNATVWLAEILPVHAGKKLHLRFFDPGESAPPATMTVQTPSGATAGNCSWNSDNGMSGSSCSITTANGSGAIFNGDWIDMIIDIPSNYTCTQSANGFSGCYWKMNLDLQTSHDRTTWSARVIGNPVRLVPNA